MLGVLIGIIAIIIAVRSGSKVDKLLSRIEMLERQVSTGSPVAQSHTQANLPNVPPAMRMPDDYQPASAALRNAFQPQAISQIPAYSSGPLSVDSFITWVSQDILMKLGALLLLMGFGWFVSYAFINNWIGPVGRVSLGLLAGLVFMGVGTWRIKDWRHQGGIFLVLGSGTVLLTIFAARELYDFLTPTLSLVVMFLSVAYVGFVSVLYQSEKLAVAGLLMAAVAPLLTNTPDPSVVGLMSYLLVVVLGTIWIVRLTGSHVLTFAALVMVFLYSLPFLDYSSAVGTDDTIALLFSFIFAGIFFVTNTISIIKVQTPAARKGQIITALGTGIYLVFWIQLMVLPQMQSIAYVFWMLIFSVGTFLVYTRTTSQAPFFIYAAVTLGLLFAATAAELSGPVLTLAYTAQVTALLLVARLYLPNVLSEKLVWLFALPVVLSLPSFVSASWSIGFLHDDFVTLVLVSVGLGIVGLVYKQTRVIEEEANHFAEILLGLSAFYVLSLIWLITHSVLTPDVATTLSLIIYTLLGLVLLVIGRLQSSRFWQLCGGVILGGVVLRLLLIDVWQMDLVGKIITFLVVGGLLISTAFIGKRQPEPEASSINTNQ